MIELLHDYLPIAIFSGIKIFFRCFFRQNFVRLFVGCFVANRFATRFCHKFFRQNFVRISSEFLWNLSWSNEICDEISTIFSRSFFCGKRFGKMDCHKDCHEIFNEISNETMKYQPIANHEQYRQTVAGGPRSQQSESTILSTDTRRSCLIELLFIGMLFQHIWARYWTEQLAVRRTISFGASSSWRLTAHKGWKCWKTWTGASNLYLQGFQPLRLVASHD